MTKNDPEGERVGYMGDRDPHMRMLKSKSKQEGRGNTQTPEILPCACSNQRPWSPKTARQKQIKERCGPT